MKERPILFSGAMVRALLAGTKAQTRRVVKLPDHFAPGDITLTRLQDGYSDGTRPVFGLDDEPNAFSCVNPYGQPGDRLWVRETWAYGIHAMAAKRDDDGPFVYAADGTTQGRLCDRWRPGIHMPRTASRITLEVTGVRVERLQDISAADAKAEGCDHRDPCDHIRYACSDIGCQGPDYRVGYRELWEQIKGPGSWDANPWVWAIDFQRLP